MRRSPRPANVSSVGRLLFAAAALSLLTLPVDYRGGAELPHAHAVIQLWLDAAHGSTNHHGRLGQPDRAAHRDHLAKPIRTVVAEGEPPDAPRLSDVTSALERPPIVAAVGMLGLALLLLRAAPVWREPVALTARRPRPETPPPRLAVAPS